MRSRKFGTHGQIYWGVEIDENQISCLCSTHAQKQIGIHTHKNENNIKMGSTRVEQEHVDWVHLAHNMNYLLITLNTAMCAGCLKHEDFLSQPVASFSREKLLGGLSAC